MQNDSSSEKAPPSASSGGTENILLFLAAPGDRRVLRDALRHRYNILADGVETLDEPFDLCVTDITRLSEAWRRLDERRQRAGDVLLPVILLASAENMDYATTLPAHVVDEVMLTPLQPERLTERIELLLKRRKLEQEVSRERDEAIASLRRARDELEDRVRDRTAELERAAERLATLAEENARLYEAEHRIAETLQSALLALPEKVRGIEFAHAYHSAAEAARVGGDVYDLFELSHDRVGVVIGDVAGKGLDAAVLTSLVKNTIRAHANERGKTPSEILHLTNDILFRATTAESFVTVFCGILDCRDGRLVYGNAGHTTSALLREDGTVAKLPVTGPLLGAFADVAFGQAETRLALDESLFLYTDGLTEARHDGEFYGEDRLFEFLASTNDGPAAEVVRKVLDDVIAFSGHRLSDDLAILAVKRVEQGTETPQQQKLEM